MAFWEGWYETREWRRKTVAIWAAAVAVGGGLIAVLVLAFAVVKPPTATADNAVLQRFALSGAGGASSTVSFNLTATLSLRNPNLYRGIQYDRMVAALSFNGTRFDEESGAVPGFDHAARKTATFNFRLGGADRPVELPAAGVRAFAAQNETGRFDVELRLDTVMQYKGRGARCPLVVLCPLELQLADPDVAATAFQVTKCTVLRANKSGC